MNLPPLPKPDSYLFQHDETGQTMFVDSQQVDWGFEKHNPRLQKIGGAFTECQLKAYARQAQREAVAAAVPDVPTDAAVWAMARKMADIFDYPWGSMPLSGRQKMFQNVKEMIAAAPGCER